MIFTPLAMFFISLSSTLLVSSFSLQWERNLTTHHPVNNSKTVNCSLIADKKLREVCFRIITRQTYIPFSGTCNIGSSDTAPDCQVIDSQTPMGCPGKLTDQTPSTESRLSTSPWITCINCRPNRFPQIIMEDRCLHVGCINEQDPSDEICSVFSASASTVSIQAIAMPEGSTNVEECTPTSCNIKEQPFRVGCACVLPSF